MDKKERCEKGLSMKMGLTMYWACWCIGVVVKNGLSV
jgi:hypothetical protein